MAGPNETQSIKEELTTIERYKIIKQLTDDNLDKIKSLIALREGMSNGSQRLPNSNTTVPNDLQEAKSLANQINNVVEMLSPKAPSVEASIESATQESTGPIR